MNRISWALCLAAMFGLVALAPIAGPAAAAGLNRTWVSGKGDDANPCTLAQPCRSLAAAVTRTAPGGEIDVLDPAGYGPVVIDRAISIVNESGFAGVQAAAGGVAITINAGAADAVHLRGLTIEGAGVSDVGIQYNTGASLDILNCVVRHFTKQGIFLAPTAAAAPLSKFTIANNVVADITGTGIDIRPPDANSITGVISNTTVMHTVTGIAVKGFASTASRTIRVTVVNGVVVDSDAYALYAASSFGHPTVELAVRNTTVERYFAYGVYASGDLAKVRLSQTMIGIGIAVLTDGGGTVQSFGDNPIYGGIGPALEPLLLK